MILEEYSGTKWPVKSGPIAVKILQVAKTKKKNHHSTSVALQTRREIHHFTSVVNINRREKLRKTKKNKNKCNIPRRGMTIPRSGNPIISLRLSTITDVKN
jgi:hypothetical protein